MSAWIAGVALLLVAGLALCGCCCNKGKGHADQGTAQKGACCGAEKGSS